MHHYDLVVIGTGSGNNIVDDAFGDLDVGIVEHGRFGGTCVNVGCIPTKMFAYTAEVADAVRGAGTFDLDARLDNVRWRTCSGASSAASMPSPRTASASASRRAPT